MFVNCQIFNKQTRKLELNYSMNSEEFYKLCHNKDIIDKLCSVDIGENIILINDDSTILVFQISNHSLISNISK